jgi:hypothetical protein
METAVFHRQPLGTTRTLVFALTLVSALPSAAFELLFTGETSFQPLPCDCAIERLGGWSQRAHTLDSLRVPERSLVFDTGGWLAGGLTPRAAALAGEAMLAFGYDAVNVGAADLRALSHLAPAVRAALPLVSGAPSRPEDVPAWRTIERGETTFIVIGVTPLGAGEPSLTDQARAAIANAPRAGTIVVLSAGGLGPARLIASSCPAVDVVLYGEGAKTPATVDLGGAIGAAAGMRGKYVGRLVLVSGRPPDLELVPVHAHAEGPRALHELALSAALAQGGRSFLEGRFAYGEE